MIWSCNWIALGPWRVAVRCGGWSPDYILCTHDAPGGDPLAAAAVMWVCPTQNVATGPRLLHQEVTCTRKEGQKVCVPSKLELIIYIDIIFWSESLLWSTSTAKEDYISRCCSMCFTLSWYWGSSLIPRCTLSLHVAWERDYMWPQTRLQATNGLAMRPFVALFPGHMQPHSQAICSLINGLGTRLQMGWEWDYKQPGNWLIPKPFVASLPAHL